MATLNQMVREFEAVLATRFVLARAELTGGDFLIIQGNALGPIVAAYPGTQEGEAAALRDVARLNRKG